MDPQNGLENSLISTPEDIGLSRPQARGILKKSQTIGGRRTIENKTQIKRMATGSISRTTRVTFPDKTKSVPICTVFEVEPIRYEDNPSPKGRSCACLIF